MFMNSTGAKVNTLIDHDPPDIAFMRASAASAILRLRSSEESTAGATVELDGPPSLCPVPTGPPRPAKLKARKDKYTNMKYDSPKRSICHR